MSKSNYHKKLGQQGWNYDGHTERALEDDFYDDDMKQKPSTGKKKSKKPTPKKCDHKHKYEDVVCLYHTDILGRPCKDVYLSTRCSICGKLNGWKHPTIYDPKIHRKRMMTNEEILKEYKDLPLVEYK
jgi:hypothetical protein